nr:MOP flippase family protein [Bacteroidota bacterium]
MTTLKSRAVFGIKWSALSQASKQGTQLLTTVILARLLAPSDFGLLGMAMVVIGFIEIFKDLGTTAAIIQKKELSEVLLSSIFWVNVGFGILAMTVLFFGAPLVGLFYRESGVVAILRVLSLSFFISSLSILQQALLQRSLAFQTLAKVEISTVVCGAVVGIALAWYGAGVWSLVLQSLTTVSITTIFLWLSSSWKPQLVFHWSEVRSISGFSLNLVGFNIFNYFIRNADYLLIGRYLGAQNLGYYTLAYRILLFPLQNISALIGRVMYPVLSKFQDDHRRFASAYLKMTAIIALISFPLMAGASSLARPFVVTVFGNNWLPVVPLIMIFALVGMTQSIGTTVGLIYKVNGRTDWMFYWGIASGTLVILAFLVGLRWGILGVAAAYVIASFLLLYPNYSIPFRLVDLEFASLIKTLRLPFLNSALMFIVLFVFERFLSPLFSEAIVLILSVILGVSVYAAANWLTNRELLKELWGLIGFKKNMPDSLT